VKQQHKITRSNEKLLSKNHTIYSMAYFFERSTWRFP